MAARFLCDLCKQNFLVSEILPRWSADDVLVEPRPGHRAICPICQPPGLVSNFCITDPDYDPAKETDSITFNYNRPSSTAAESK